ncbi:uncharacterized protein LOC108936102 [Scleropages formosus]|uniref:uncharacterized protein LOC108936102 n=1 Tax=Scleropages formosus TaxID=113540 RepID=UPI000878D017|nr:uncharacterized protein LOC108936102 [Scleropages formosus]
MVALYACSVHVILAFMTILTEVVAPEVQSKCSESMRNITAVSGSTVHLPCLECLDSLEHFNTLAVQWNKTRSFCHYRMTQNNTSNMLCRDRVELKGHPAEVYLRDLQLTDSGVYRCSVTKVIPPPTLEIFSHQLKLHVIDIIVGDLNSSNQNCTLQLWCMVVGLLNVTVNFTWSRKTNEGWEVLQHREHSTNQNSTLELCDGGCNNADVFNCSINTSGISGFKIFILPSRKGLCVQDLLMIIGLSLLPLAIILVLLTIGCITYQKRRRQRDEAMMYTNKVYENFNFTTPIPTPSLSEDEKHEHCIYEN